MDMNDRDEQLIRSFCDERGVQEQTRLGYMTTVGIYCQFHEMTFYELLEEAEQEERENIRWKFSKLRSRLLSFRNFLIKEDYLINTIQVYMGRLRTIYEEGFDIEIGKMPKINQRNAKKPEPICYTDLPDKELLRHIIKMVNPLMKAIILFMTSSGCAKRETLNLTVKDFVDATYEYHHKRNIYDAIEILNGRDDIVPSWKLRRQKTNKYYTAFSSPESTAEIIHYLLSEERKLKNPSKLFSISDAHLNNTFNKINRQLKLGKVGTFNRFRSHMLRKFHASQLYNDGLSMDEIDELQGRGKDRTRTSYFMENPLRLREKYIEHMSAITINADVEKLTIKSPDFMKMESENRFIKSELDELKTEVSDYSTVKAEVADLRAFKDEILHQKNKV